MTTAEQYRTATTTLYDQALVELDEGDTRAFIAQLSSF